MDPEVILILTLAAALIIAILVMAGLMLSARAFTQLAELIRYIGSSLVQQHQETRQVVTTSLREMEGDSSSAQKEDTPTRQG